VDADVVVIGAGSAGCVLAARLSEQPGLRVLLLEAGPDYPEVNDLPAELRDGSRPAFTHDWGYRSEPGALGRTIDLARVPLGFRLGRYGVSYSWGEAFRAGDERPTPRYAHPDHLGAETPASPPRP
jgi:choline dehydrogenase-like flavoprotein